MAEKVKVFSSLENNVKYMMYNNNYSVIGDINEEITIGYHCGIIFDVDLHRLR